MKLCPDDLSQLRPRKVPRIAPDEKKELLTALMGGGVFTDRHFRSDAEAKQMLPSVFMPILFGAFAAFPKSYLEDVGLIYEFMDKAGMRCVNGYPTFLSLRLLGKEDTKEVMEAWKEADKTLGALFDGKEKAHGEKQG